MLGHSFPTRRSSALGAASQREWEDWFKSWPVPFTTLADVSVGLQSLRDVNLLYAGGHDLTDPFLSPLFGDVTGFPPTLLIAGTRDLFLSNTVRMHRKLRESGVDADLHIFDGRPHAGYGNAPEEAAVFAEIDRKSTRLNSRHPSKSRMPSSA